jgi:acyl-coenzyme A synthetase/AMP-(fatty) acid ligase
MDCGELYRRAGTLAATLAGRMPEGSVVSFMLPNWYEAAVVYLGATLAGMVVNPILPSLRDHELRFILDDADSRMIFAPGTFRGHDYADMLGRVTAAMQVVREVVVVRDARRPQCLPGPVRRRALGAHGRTRSGCGPDDHVHLGHHRTAQGRSPHA